MANVIVEIHGLKNKPAKPLLEHWWKLAMLEGLKSQNFKAQLPKYEMVYWADVLYDKPLNAAEKDKESPYFMDEKYVKQSKNFVSENHSTRKKVIDFVNKQLKKIFLNEDLSLNYTFITDTILGNYFQDLDAYYSTDCSEDKEKGYVTKDVIRNRLLQVLEKYKKDDIMLIGHSMGSIIAYDVLTLLASHINIHTFITLGSPLGLPIVVGNIAAEQKQKLNGQKQMFTPSGILNNWYNFSDIMDKVAIDYQLSDDFAPNSHGVKPLDVLVVNNYQSKGIPNPHKSYGYLRTPEFARVLNEFISTERLTWKEKILRKFKGIITSVKSHILIQKGKFTCKILR